MKEFTKDIYKDVISLSSSQKKSPSREKNSVMSNYKVS